MIKPFPLVRIFESFPAPQLLLIAIPHRKSATRILTFPFLVRGIIWETCCSVEILANVEKICRIAQGNSGVRSAHNRM